MILLLNSTKTMDLAAAVPARLATTVPLHQAEAEILARPLAKLGPARLEKLMAVKGDLAARTRADLAQWGGPGRPRKPALLAFTGLVYRYLDAPSLTAPQWKRARERLRILSGLYGLLRPQDLVEAYRLEMGCRFRPDGVQTLAAFWKSRITSDLNGQMKDGETVLCLASQEYARALDKGKLRGPVISPVFKERRSDGSLRTAPVHAKMARGALARFALAGGARQPRDLIGFGEMGWEPAAKPPAEGPWLFVRVHRG